MICYPIPTPLGELTRLRVRRLLALAGKPADHKRFHHQYYYLVHLGLVGWMIGAAYLTKKGEAELKRLQEQEITWALSI